MKWLLLIPVAAALAACAATPEQKAQQAQMDDAECQGWGLTPNDPRYVQCRALLTERRANSDLAVTKGIFHVLANAGPPPAPYMPPKTSFQCTGSSVGGAQVVNCF